jgi:hypothetical protein
MGLDASAALREAVAQEVEQAYAAMIGAAQGATSDEASLAEIERSRHTFHEVLRASAARLGIGDQSHLVSGEPPQSQLRFLEESERAPHSLASNVTSESCYNAPNVGQETGTAEADAARTVREADRGGVARPEGRGDGQEGDGGSEAAAGERETLAIAFARYWFSNPAAFYEVDSEVAELGIFAIRSVHLGFGIPPELRQRFQDWQHFVNN